MAHARAVSACSGGSAPAAGLPTGPVGPRITSVKRNVNRKPFIVQLICRCRGAAGGSRVTPGWVLGHSLV
eukprot:15478542-Alexandrium_andersonii.AAC.2